MRAGLSIGDFSRITHLSVKTLRRYHEAGLLQPAEVDPHTGYRYYATTQVPTAQVIRRFRELGMPVREVRDVLATTDPQARGALIAGHLEWAVVLAPMLPPSPGAGTACIWWIRCRCTYSRHARQRAATRPLRSPPPWATPGNCQPGASQDAVLLFGPLYHLTDAADRRQALSEARRVLRPGGRLLAMAVCRFASLLD